MIKKNKISEAELEIMKIVWEKQAPAASTEIVRTLKQRCGWEDATIYTMLSKLVKKGALLRDKRFLLFRRSFGTGIYPGADRTSDRQIFFRGFPPAGFHACRK